jgi:hypothetical protein
MQLLAAVPVAVAVVLAVVVAVAAAAVVDHAVQAHAVRCVHAYDAYSCAVLQARADQLCTVDMLYVAVTILIHISHVECVCTAAIPYDLLPAYGAHVQSMQSKQRMSAHTLPIMFVLHNVAHRGDKRIEEPQKCGEAVWPILTPSSAQHEFVHQRATQNAHKVPGQLSKAAQLKIMTKLNSEEPPGRLAI